MGLDNLNIKYTSRSNKLYAAKITTNMKKMVFINDSVPLNASSKFILDNIDVTPNPVYAIATNIPSIATVFISS